MAFAGILKPILKTAGRVTCPESGSHTNSLAEERSYNVEELKRGAVKELLLSIIIFIII